MEFILEIRHKANQVSRLRTRNSTASHYDLYQPSTQIMENLILSYYTEVK